MKKNQFDYKKILKIALILMLVAGMSGVLIVSLNTILEPIVTKNRNELEQKSLQEIYQGATFTQIEFNDAPYINKVYAIGVDDIIVGYVYNVSGKNPYGSISLLVGISLEGNVNKVVITENNQSFAKIASNHINNTYQSGSINADNIEDVDVKCGATYSAKLIKELIDTALMHYQGGNGHE